MLDHIENVPPQNELMTIANTVYGDVVAITIDSDDMAQIAADQRNEVNAQIKKLNDMRMSATRPLDQAKAQIIEWFKPAVDKLTEAKGIIDRAIVTYTTEQERRRREEQARLEAAAAAERERLAKQAQAAAEEAERLRLEAEAEAKRGNAAAAQAAQEAAEQAAQQAAVIETTSAMIIAPAATEPVKLAGASIRTSVDFELTDMTAFARWVVGQLDHAPHLINLLAVDAVKLRAHVKTYGPDKKEPQIPGVRIFAKGTVAGRKAA